MVDNPSRFWYCEDWFGWCFSIPWSALRGRWTPTPLLPPTQCRPGDTWPSLLAPSRMILQIFSSWNVRCYILGNNTGSWCKTWYLMYDSKYQTLRKSNAKVTPATLVLDLKSSSNLRDPLPCMACPHPYKVGGTKIKINGQQHQFYAICSLHSSQTSISGGVIHLNLS